MRSIPCGVILRSNGRALRRCAFSFSVPAHVADLRAIFLLAALFLPASASFASPAAERLPDDITTLLEKLDPSPQEGGFARQRQPVVPDEARVVFRATLHDIVAEPANALPAITSPAITFPKSQAKQAPAKAPDTPLVKEGEIAPEMPHFIKAMSNIRALAPARNGQNTDGRGADASVPPKASGSATGPSGDTGQGASAAGLAVQRAPSPTIAPVLTVAPLLTLAPLPAFEPSEDEPVMALMPVMRGSLRELAAETALPATPDVATTASLPAKDVSDMAADSARSAELARKVDLSLLKEPRRAPRSVTSRTGFRLADAVAKAVMTYPEIKVNEARLREAKAGIDASAAGLYPKADFRLAAGGNFSGNYEGRPIPYTTAANALDTRFDGGIILRQLVYDFGATRSDIQRAEFLRDAEKLKLREKIDEIAYKTSQNFLKILEQRALLNLIDETIASHEHLARIVQAHAKEGHGTLADVARVNSRLVDVRAIRSDISLQLMSAEDQFQRLTRTKATSLAEVPELARVIPAGSAAAIQKAITNNPRLGAIHATRRSAEKELESQRASALPRLNLEIDSESKNFRNHSAGRTQLEGRAMLAMTYRFMDGGLSSAANEQIAARIEGSDMSYLNEREQMEADIRQAYRAIESSGRKTRLVGEGVASAERVKVLYLEQFKGGKRTIFELLDGQMSYYTSRKSQIESQYEGRRAMFDILRAMGDLTVVLSKGAV